MHGAQRPRCMRRCRADGIARVAVLARAYFAGRRGMTF